MTNPAELARLKIAEIDSAIASLSSERSDWQALLDAAERLGSRLTGDAMENQAVGAHVRASTRARVVGTFSLVEPSRVTKKSQVLSIALSLLSDGAHRQAKEIAQAVAMQGVDLGIDPIQYVSVLLSRDDRFVSERAKGGWTLAQNPNKEETPLGVDAPAGSDLLDFDKPTPDEGTGPTPD